MNALASGLFYSEEARQAYAMLAEGECLALLEEAKRRIEDMTSVSYLRDVALMLDVLGKKVAWERKKQGLTRARPNPMLQTYIEQLVDFVADTRYSQNEEMLKEVSRLAA